MEDLHESIASYLREQRDSAARNEPRPATEPRDLLARLTLLAAAFGRDWLTALRHLPAFVQAVAAEAGEARLTGMDEYPGIVRTEMRHSGPPHQDQPHSTAPNEAQQAIRILRDARLWPWQRALWRADRRDR